MLTLIPGLCFMSCKNQSAAEGVVKFMTNDQVISTDHLVPVTFTLSINPRAPKTSAVYIGISSYGGKAGNAYTVSPGISGKQIVLPVDAGDRSVSFTITPLQEGIGFNTVVIDLEIIDTRDGLFSGGLMGVYSSLTILNHKDQTRTLPFTENFDDCDFEGGHGYIPAGWEEMVIKQNSLGTGHWICSSTFDGIECNAFSTNGKAGDSCEVWLLTPPVDLIDASKPALTLILDRRFETSDFQEYNVKISTDYNGSNFAEADWSVFTPAVSAIEANDPERDNYETFSNLDLSAFSGEVVTIAFIYYAEGSRYTATILRLALLEIR